MMPESVEERKDAVVHVRLEEALIERMDKFMRAGGYTTRSAYIRRAILREVRRDEDLQKLEDNEWKEKVRRIRGYGTDDPFPDSK